MLVQTIQQLCTDVLSSLNGEGNPLPEPLINRTRKEFEGDYTLVVFPYVRFFKKKPEEVADLIGSKILEDSDLITGYNVVKGFLNLSVDHKLWQTYIATWDLDKSLSTLKGGKKVMVEFCSPNTNKPLHLGHIRNILLGWSASKILEAAGNEVVKTQIINDRGIAICKSMLAWQLFGEGSTPSSTNTKGDFFVGRYYVLFEQKFQEEYKQWQQSGEGQSTYQSEKKDGEEDDHFFKRYRHTYFNVDSSLGRKAKEMLIAWEAKDDEVYSLWKTMNQWVYDGFEVTYKKLGIGFDALYYESDTYLKGKEMCDEGLAKGVFLTKEDGSVWADLTDVGMDEKIILRADGTALYITQDLGTAQQRYEDHQMDSGVYVVGDEQDYHFKVLFELLKRLDKPFAKDLFHLSYGMVDLPSGKMKSREGTVVDADDLVEEVITEAAANANVRGELDDMSTEEIQEIHRRVGLGALKFFILKVHPKKRMTFNPQESLDMQGQTGPYIQNAYVRIASVLRKSDEMMANIDYPEPSDLEKDLIKDMMNYPAVIQEAAKELDPSQVAHYAYNLAKDYHRFYHDHRILTADTQGAKAFRLQLSRLVKGVLNHAMDLLGIEMPEKM